MEGFQAEEWAYVSKINSSNSLNGCKEEERQVVQQFHSSKKEK